MPTNKIDPITSTLIQNRLGAIVDEAGNIIRLLSGSPVASQFHDMNTAFLNADGDVLAQGVFLIFHSIGISAVVKSILREYQENPGINEDDMFICNNPYDGAPHQCEVIVVAPIHYRGRLVAWSGISIHQADVGGPVFGQIAFGAQNIYEEQIPMPAFKIIERGLLRKDLEKEFLIRSRVADLCRVDFRAEVAANNTVKTRFIELLDEYGAETVLKVLDDVVDLTEAKFRDRVRELPDGTWRHRAYMDYEDRIYVCHLEMTKRGDSLVFDFDADGQAPAVVNSTKALTDGNVLNSVLMLLCFGGIPWCPAGLMRAMVINTKPGTILDCMWPAGACAGGGGANVLAVFCVDTCIAQMLDASEKYREYVRTPTASGLAIVELAGIDQYGRPFFTPILDGVFGTGMGARSYKDGTHSSGVHAAMDSSISNVESMEQLHPVLYLSRYHLPDGCGAGKFVGGSSIAPLWMPYGVEEIGQVITHGFGVAPQSVGISGGYPGVFYQAMIKRDANVLEQFAQGKLPTDFSQINGQLEMTASMHKTSVGKTDVYYDCATIPAAGYGDPIERDPERVLNDVVNFLVTEEGARQTYGVVFTRDETNRLSVDEAGTDQRRKEIKEARKRQGRIPEKRIGAGRSQGKMAKGTSAQRMNEYLSIVQINHERVIQCRCGCILGPADQNYKEMSLVVESPARNVAPGIEVSGLAKEFVFREFCCPDCQVLLATEVARIGDPYVWDIQLKV